MCELRCPNFIFRFLFDDAVHSRRQGIRIRTQRELNNLPGEGRRRLCVIIVPGGLALIVIYMPRLDIFSSAYLVEGVLQNSAFVIGFSSQYF